VPDKKTFYLIDANGYIHRAYHALPPLTNSKGEPVQAVFGFARMLLKILRAGKPDYMAVCFDTAAPTFRHKAYADYKGHRKPTEDALLFQLPLAKEMVERWGFPTLAVDGYEADDIIATLADQGADDGLHVVIVTGDKDALQLVNGDISVLNEMRNVTYTPVEVEKKYGLTPRQMVDYFALTGDSVDNVPGVPGVGEKTATQLLQTYGTLDKLFKHTGELKGALKTRLEENHKQALMSRDLVVLDRKVPLKLKPKDCVFKGTEPAEIAEFFKRMEFNALVQEVGAAPAPKGERVVHAVKTEKDFAALSKALGAAKELSVDVETTGLNPLRVGLVGIALCTKPGEAWYIPYAHNEIAAAHQKEIQGWTKDIVGPFLADPNLPKVGHNLKYDLLILRRHGLPLGGVDFDTLIASYCLNPSRLNHGLKDLCRDTLGESMTAIDELIGRGAKQITMDHVAVSRAADYAGADVEVSLRLKKEFAPLIKEKKLEKLFHEVEMPLVTLLAEMEETGVRVDLAYLEKLGARFSDEIAALEKEIHKLAGQEFNLNSSKQLSAVLFEKLKLPVIRRTKTGISTDEEVLRKLSAQHPLPAKMVEYRELTKLKSTYIDALLALADPKTSRVHTNFNQAVAATGRLSSTDPNLQNIPIRTDHGREIRKAFVPEKGHVFLAADYSQIDLRVLAHVSGDKALLDAFRRGGDIHAATAREIFGLKDDDKPSADQRRVAKSVNFGIVYGQTAFGLSQQLGIDMAEAREYIEKYLARYGGVRQWIDRTLHQARKDGFVTTILNRVRYLPEINAANHAVRSFAERTAMNTPIQGSSADIIKVAMLQVAEKLEAKKLKSRLLLQVHDDLLLEVPKGEVDDAAALVRTTMEGAVKLDVPIVADVKTGVNWSEMEPLK